MNAQQFHGAADGPELVIDRATDGTPLVNGRGWSCGYCEVIWAMRGEADRCCTDADRAGETSEPPVRPRLRLYDPE